MINLLGQQSTTTKK